MRKKLRGASLVMPDRMYLFVVPALLLFLVFWVYPVLQMFFYSVTNFNGIDYNYDFVGIKNFRRILEDGSLVNATKNTLIYTVVNVLCTNVLGLVLALFLNLSIKAKGLFRTICYIPALFSAIVVGFIWSYVYMPGSGMISSVMDTIGLDGSSFNLIGNFKWALYGIIIVDIWKNVGTTMIIYLAGLQTIDESLVEAGKIDGASEWQLYTKIALPLLKNAQATIIILCFGGIWNESGTSTTYIYKEQLRSLGFFMSTIGGGIARQGVAGVTALIMTFPSIIIFVIQQSRVMDTMAHSGIK